MRKFLWVVAVGALVLLVAAPAMALDFKFGAEYRVRFYDYANTFFDKTNTSPTGQNDNTGAVTNRGNPRGVQIRVRPRFDVSDDNGNIQATIRFEYGDTDFGGTGGANGSSFGTNEPGDISIASRGNRTGNGAGGAIGADGVALETKWAYIDFAMPFGVPLRVRAGVQPWYLPKGLVIDDDIAGVRAYGKASIVSYEAFWFRANHGAALSAGAPAGTTGQPQFDSTRDDSMDFYGGKIDFAIAPWLNPGVYYVYGDNRANCMPNAIAGTQFVVGPCAAGADRVRPQHFGGVTVTGKVGIVDYDFDFVYGYAKGGTTGSLVPGGINITNGTGTICPIAANCDATKVQGWVIDAGVHIPVGPLKFNLLGTYATGDKQDDPLKSKAFPMGPGPSWSGSGGQFELIGEGGAFDVVSATQHSPTGLWMIGATVEYVPVKPLWLRLGYGYAGFTEKLGNCGTAFNVNATTGALTQRPNTTCYGPIYVGKASDPIGGNGTGESTLGQEIHLRADYTIWTGFKVQGMVGWLIPSKGDTMGKYILQLYYNF